MIRSGLQIQTATRIPSETVEGIRAARERGPDAIRRTLTRTRTKTRTRTGVKTGTGIRDRDRTGVRDSKMADGKNSGKTDNHKERPI